MFDLVSIIGGLAATLTTISFVPQVIHSYRTRDLSGVSLTMYSIFTAGIGFWLVYGVFKQDWPLIFSNTITFCLAGTMLFLKIKQSIKK